MNEPHPAERFFSGGHPIVQYLALEFKGASNGVLVVELAAPEAFVVDVKTGRLHPGLATLVLDTVMGSTVMGELERIQPIATAGLTTQHMRRPVAGEKLICTARFGGIHQDMAHVGAQLTARDTAEVLSTASGTFMIGTRSKPLGVRV